MVSKPLTPQPKQISILLAKISSLKQKTNEILPAAIKKIKFCLFKEKASCSLKL